MATVNLGDKNFRETLDGHDIVIIDFWADWCGPCKMFGPIFEEVSEQYNDVVFGKVDTEAEQQLSAYFQIRSIPTIMVIREKIVVFQHSGVIGKDDLKKVLDQVKGLDMEKVKADVEKEEQGQA